MILATAFGWARSVRAGSAHPLSEQAARRVYFDGDDFEPLRGATIGPIENAYHPGKGYGSMAYSRTLREVVAMGGGWVVLTPFGRVNDLSGVGVDPTFETAVVRNQADVGRAVLQAHALGLRVMIVPHLWVESGGWRAEIDPKTTAGWKRWEQSYRAFLLGWARVAEASGVDLLSVGVELRSWVTTTHAPSFESIVSEVRALYHGPLTYSANWDDAEDTVIWGKLDVIGINAFYPLADEAGAPLDKMRVKAREHTQNLAALAKRWGKRVLFTEIGYTARQDPALKPWEWPDGMKNVHVVEPDQARAYAALLAETLDQRFFAGFFVWRLYADPDDVSQESEWGFSPRGKLAELTVRDAFRSPEQRSMPWFSRTALPLWPVAKAETPGLYP
jgi:hypothetical protein